MAKSFVAISVILILIVLSIAGYFAFQGNQTAQQGIPLQTVPTTSPHNTSPTPNTSPITSERETYSNTSAGFSIDYPIGWRIVEDSGSIGFGPKEISEDTLFGVSYYAKTTKTISQIKDEIGKQFSDRKQTEEIISFNNITATKIVTTTNKFSDWYSVNIILDRGNMLYVVDNGSQTDSVLNEMLLKRTGKPSNLSFSDFYTSFKFIK